MVLWEKILHPNKEYESLFRKIKAEEILKEIIEEKGGLYPPCKNRAKTNIYVSLVDFFTFREKLINAMFDEDEMLSSKKNSVFNAKEHLYGYYWIRVVFGDVYNENILIDTSW